MRGFSISTWVGVVIVAVALFGQAIGLAQQPEGYDWATPMRKLAAEFRGESGKVLRLGDSITYANPGTAFLRYGEDRNPQQLAVCRWMKADVRDKTSGVWLSIDDQPGGRSHTAASGVTTGQFLEGGKGGLPKLDDILAEHKPQVAVILLGTNDLAQGVSLDQYGKNLSAIVDKVMAAKCIPVLTTIPPIARDPALAVKFNEVLRKLAEERKLPLIDYHGEIVSRRKDDWKGTLISNDGVHPTAKSPAGPATEENLSQCGYLLLGWCTLNKLMEIKSAVVDRL